MVYISTLRKTLTSIIFSRPTSIIFYFSIYSRFKTFKPVVNVKIEYVFSLLMWKYNYNKIEKLNIIKDLNKSRTKSKTFVR